MIKSKKTTFDIKLFKKILKFSKNFRLTYYLLLFSAIALSVFSTLQPYLLKIIIDDYIIPKDYKGLQILVLVVVLILVLEVLFQAMFIFYASWLGQKVVKELRVVLYNKIVNFKMSYFDNTAIGRLVTRAVSDIEVVASIFSQGLFMILADFLKMGIIIIVMISINFKLSLIVFSILPIIVYATKLFQRSMKRAFEDVRNQVAELNTFIQERINGMKIVQLFNREKIDFKIFKEINESHKKAWLKTVWYNSIFFPVAEISTSITIGLLVWYGGLEAALYQTTSIGTIFLFIKMSQMLFQPLRQIADKFNTLQMGMVAADRVFNIIETESNIKDEGKIHKHIFKGLIEIKNLRFSYNKGEEVLKGINLKINSGEKIAIVGATGAGKTTIINLITRFYDFSQGDILFDGISIKKFNLKVLRKNVAMVLQNVFLFADSIHNNISIYDSKLSRDKIITAAKEIGIHDFISTLPKNYDYDVKERGVMLSSGQRQLISFLRAYLINSSILILDEATSSIDSYSEELIQKAIEKITKGKTSIIIAHRLATIKKADRIIVMDKGKIVEQGNHYELMNITNGFYYKLYNSQFFHNDLIKEKDLY